MKKVFLLLICIYALAACNRYPSFFTPAERDPVLTSINIVDRNGFSETISNPDRLAQFENTNFLKGQPYQKVLRIYSRDKHGDIKAFITSYYPNGMPKQYLEVLNNRAKGMYREWHENGSQKLEGYVMGGTADLDTGAEKTWLFHGSSYAWDEEGRLLAHIPYDKGVLEGLSLYFHVNGNTWKEIPISKGKIEGTQNVYLSDGTLFQTMTFVNGVKHGKCCRYWEKDKIASEEIYSLSLLTSGSYFDKLGVLLSKVENGTGSRIVFSKDKVSEIQEYRNGIPEGFVKVYNDKGILASMHHVKDGIKHGEELAYYDGTTNPKLSVNWIEGKIQGIVKTWYPNRIQESCREMSNNQKNGLLTAWYEDGSLMLIEEYEKDKLVKGEYYPKGESNPVSTVISGQGIVTLYDQTGNFVKKIPYMYGKPEVQ